MTHHLCQYNTKFSVKLASKFLQQARNILILMSRAISSTCFPSLKSMYLFADKKECLGQGIVYIVPSSTRTLPGTNIVSKGVLVSSIKGL